MRKLFAGALLLASAQSASAATYFATIDGKVDSTFATMFTAPGATSPIKVGDTITATLSWNTGASVAEMLARGFGALGANTATFKLGEFTWTSNGDFWGEAAPRAIADAADPLAGYRSIMDDARGAGDLKITGYAFEIGEFGYDLYEGPGFAGVFDKNTLRLSLNGEQMIAPVPGEEFAAAPVPEPATWAMMVLGFAAAGLGIRRRTLHPAAV
jgi:hypothetical protein